MIIGRFWQIPDAVALPFLVATHRNAAVGSVSLKDIHFVLESAAFEFLCKAEYDVADLILWRCDMAEATQ